MSDDLYGTDIEMSATGDLQVSAGGDLSLVTDTTNLKQAIYNRLMTVPDDYLFGDFGSTLRPSVDALITNELKTALPQDITAALMNDSRVSSVSNVSIDSSNDTLQVQVSVVTAFGDSVSVGLSP